MPGILVVTHNGKMPRDGGIRLGYQVENCIVNLRGQASFIGTSKPKPEAEKETPKAPEIIYWNLPRAMSSGGCIECGGDCYFQYVMTDRGRKEVVICDDCGEIMRPRY